MARGMFALLVAAEVVAWPGLGRAQPPAERSVSLAQDPLVMRLSKDEFRIAFGLKVKGCGANGCNGMIRYRVAWQTDDGTALSELRFVSYSVPPLYSRAMTVDRQYFDTAEGAHTTDILKVTVDTITCADGLRPSPALVSSSAPASQQNAGH